MGGMTDEAILLDWGVFPEKWGLLLGMAFIAFVIHRLGIY